MTEAFGDWYCDPPPKPERVVKRSPNTSGNYTGESEGPTGDHVIHYAEKVRIMFAKGFDGAAPVIVLAPFGHVGINLIFVFWFVNSAWLQGTTSQSLGKMIVGINLVYESKKYWEHRTYLCVPGVMRCTIRLCCHFIDMILFWGWLRPLLYPEGRTYADSCVKTSVIRDKRCFPLWTVSEMRENRKAEK